MKLTLIAVASTVVALSLSAQAEDMPGMKMDSMPMKGMQMAQETQQAPVAKAEGTIKAVDTTKHTVTIAHGAVPAVQVARHDHGIHRNKQTTGRPEGWGSSSV